MKLRFKKYFAEALGTAMLVFIGCGAGIAVGTDYKKGTGYLLTALAFGLAFIALYYGLSHISGCHLNPAVSFSMLITKNMGPGDFIGYTAAQIAGACGGCGLITCVFWGHAGDYSANTYYNAAFYSTFIVEMLMTMIVVAVFLNTYKKQMKSAGVINGLTILLVYVFSIQLTGGSANPARTLATAIFAGGEFISEAWIIIGGAFTGALIGGLFHMLFVDRHEDAAEGSTDGAEINSDESEEEQSAK